MIYGYYTKDNNAGVKKTMVHIFRTFKGNITRSLCGASFYRNASNRGFVNLGDIDTPKLNIPHSDICGNCIRC